MDASVILSRLSNCSIPADEDLARRLWVYHCMLRDWNTRMDLTAVTDDDEMLDRHYVDSLMPLTLGLIPEKGSMIDVGTGAGFPGLPIALAREDLHVVLLDSQQKRLNFLQAVCTELHVHNVELVHARAEDGARQAALRDHFDLAVARAVAPLPVLCEYLLPYVAPGGRALCWKGPSVSEELDAGKRAAHLLGGRLEQAVPYTVPGRDFQHTLVPLVKVSNTPKIYPRKAGTPSKAPLGAN